MSRRGQRYYTDHVEVEVEIPYAEILENLEDSELAEFGLMRVEKAFAVRLADGDKPDPNMHSLCSDGLYEHLEACAKLRAS